MRVNASPKATRYAGATASTDSPRFDGDSGRKTILKGFEMRRNLDQNVNDYNYFENQRIKNIQPVSTNLPLDNFNMERGRVRSISPSFHEAAIALQLAQPNGIAPMQMMETPNRPSALKKFALRPSTGSAQTVFDPTPTLHSIDPTLMRQQIYDKPANGIHALKAFMKQ